MCNVDDGTLVKETGFNTAGLLTLRSDSLTFGSHYLVSVSCSLIRAVCFSTLPTTDTFADRAEDPLTCRNQSKQQYTSVEGTTE